MGSTVYTIALMLTILWAVSYFGYKYEGAIHILLAVAIFMALFQFIRGMIRK